MCTRSFRLGAASLVTALLASSIATAQTADTGRLRTPATARGGITIDSATTLLPLEFSAGTTLHYARNPVVWRYPFNTYEPIIGQQLFLDVAAAIGVIYGVDVSVVVPTVLQQRGPIDAGLGDLRGGGVGDLRVAPRLALTTEQVAGFGSALIAELTFPTGDEARFLGDPGVSFRPRLVASVPFDFLRLNGALAYRWRENAAVRPVGVSEAVGARQGLDLGDEIEFQAGVEARIDGGLLPWSVLIELAGATAASRPFTGEGLAALEIIGGVRGRVAKLVDLTVAGAGGLSQGVGTPMYRVIVGLTFSPDDTDTDHDGIPDRLDACPLDAEDFDDYEDKDGCPELDNDNDGVPDRQDRCPLVPETVNGIADQDGCPDGAALDKDGDGLEDDVDQCPLEPEDIDGFQDEDGCPDPDNDRDGVPDFQDECPDEKESINGVEDYDGCPDEGEGATRYVERDRIAISETINFETGKSVLRPESKPVLDQVALQILAHPEIQRVRIEGHTDSAGSEEDNLYLSQDRADAVRRYLIGRGVEAARLEAVGYGESRPIQSNDTAAGRARNRRVEFVILESR